MDILEFYRIITFLFAINYVFLWFIYQKSSQKKSSQINQATNWQEDTITHYLATNELAYIFENQKFVKILDHKKNPIKVKSKNMELFSTSNKIVKIRKYRFRAKDFNSLGLQINLDLKFVDKEKGLIYINNNSMNYYDYDRNKIETLIEMDVVSKLQDLLKEYTRNEFFGNVEEIAQKLKANIKDIVREKTGYEIENLWIFELNI